MVITMEDYGKIRRLFTDGYSQREIARTLGISRKTVRKYCRGDTISENRKTPERVRTMLTDENISFIQKCLAEDAQESLQKQHHTARRIYTRLVEEMQFAGGESTIRCKVRELKNKLPEMYMPLAFYPGEAVQVDWGEAFVYNNGKKTRVNLFCAILCDSGAPFVAAYSHQNEESFLEGFVQAFDFFGGVPRKAIFDNARVAVKSGYGSSAVVQPDYAKLAAHYAFEPVFCNPRKGNEKGLVESLVGWCRRNFLVPLPHVESIQQVSLMLKQNCEKYIDRRVIAGKPASVSEMFAVEKRALIPLPGYRFETAKVCNVQVSRNATVRFATNEYSVPVKFCGYSVSLKAYPEIIQIYSEGTLIAEHKRSYGKHDTIYELEHYLPILERKGRSIFNAAPVRQNIPYEFLEWIQRQDYEPKQIIQAFHCCAQYGYESVMAYGIEDHPICSAEEIFDPVNVPDIDLGCYDELLETTEVVR